MGRGQGASPASVTLSVVAGQLNPTVFTAKERITCIIGRASDCIPHVPDDAAHRTVSRHHCLLDINPPDIRIRDFGSRNGTYLMRRRSASASPAKLPRTLARCAFPSMTFVTATRSE